MSRLLFSSLHQPFIWHPSRSHEAHDNLLFSLPHPQRIPRGLWGDLGGHPAHHHRSFPPALTSIRCNHKAPSLSNSYT